MPDALRAAVLTGLGAAVVVAVAVWLIVRLML